MAAEPDIPKPMNLAFDARGRLWVSGSLEYPYPAAAGQGRDSVRILEDTNGDGRADRITPFVDGLNIPIGLYPYRDGVVVYSIDRIDFWRDTDGDDRADTRELLYGPLGQPVDTHGMQNAFRRGSGRLAVHQSWLCQPDDHRGRDGSRSHVCTAATPIACDWMARVSNSLPGDKSIRLAVPGPRPVI